MTIVEEKQKFIDVAKLMLKDRISTNPEKLKEYREKIIIAKNKFTTYATEQHKKAERSQKASIESNADYVLTKFIAFLNKLKCNYNLSGDLFSIVDAKDIGPPSKKRDEEENYTSSGGGW